MKTCLQCGISKPDHEYYRLARKNLKGRVQEYVLGKCKECTKKRVTSFNKAHSALRARRARADHAELRMRAIEAYGASCQSCGEEETRFLCIDHIDGGGRQQKKSIRGKFRSLYVWLKKNGYPDGYQTLCENCNFVKEMGTRIKRPDRENLREKVFRKYGSACQCCGNNDKRVFHIDHVNGGGTKHRALIGNIYAFLAARDVSLDYQILCANCNRAKQVLGACPHYVARRFDTMLIVGLS